MSGASWPADPRAQQHPHVRHNAELIPNSPAYLAQQPSGSGPRRLTSMGPPPAPGSSLSSTPVASQLAPAASPDVAPMDVDEHGPP